jgi:hypothetical protein
MTLYKALKNSQIDLGANAVLDYDCGEGKILIPGPNSKVYVHWLTDKGQIRSTYTMTYATKLTGKLRLTNSNIDTKIQVLDLD